jgi:sulfur-oxidizing protein SoxA
MVDRTSPADRRQSGFAHMSPDLQAMQRDDASNPGMLWVKQGESLWSATPAGSGPSCAACHGPVQLSMSGVAARYPAWDPRSQQPLNLQMRINQCHTRHQQAQPWRLESQELLSLESYIALQSRHLPIQPDPNPRMQAVVQAGKERYQQRIGQLDLSCAQCHEQRDGLLLGGTVIPQSHPVGYPMYRLEWQGMGSLGRRLRNCMNGVRARPWAYGSPEHIELEAYLARQAAGMPLESPGIRP